jgi:hypothetical protein
LSTSYAGQSVRLRRASDSTQQDIGFVGNDFDLAAATTFCNATSCFLAKWYDQSGSLRDLAQATAANQPALVFGCLGGAPCARVTSGTTSMAGVTSITPVGGPVTLALVSRRVVVSLSCAMVTENSTAGNRLYFPAGANTYFLAGNIGNFTAPEVDGQWHSATGVINAAASFLAVDAVAPVTGSVTTSVTVGAPTFAGGASTTCDEVEAMVWDNFAMSQAQATALNASQKAYWGF